jgi:hypothetical protein
MGKMRSVNPEAKQQSVPAKRKLPQVCANEAELFRPKRSPALRGLGRARLRRGMKGAMRFAYCTLCADRRELRRRGKNDGVESLVALVATVKNFR